MVRHGTKICQRPGSVRGESKEESQEFMKSYIHISDITGMGICSQYVP